MQNVQNADIQRVMNLVDLYRTKVGKESQKAKDLAEEYKRQYDAEIDFAYSLHEQGIDGYCLDIQIAEDDVNAIRANEQLLGYFYKEVAGDNVDSDVLSYFLAEKYDPSIFTDEEDSFLKSHFTEMVNYIIETPNNDLQAVEGDDRNDIDLLPKEVLDLVKERFTIPSGSKVYNPFTGFAQLACLYKDCSFFCEESYMSFYKRWNAHCDKLRETEHIVESKVDENKLHAWMKVALYANNIEAFVVEEGSIPQNYDAVVSYIPYIPRAIPNLLHVMGDEPSDPDIINKIVSAYQNLANGGKMILIIPTEYLWEKKIIAFGEKTAYSLVLETLWKQVIDDNSLVEVIQLPSVMGKSFYNEEHCIVIAEKGCESKDVSFMDARFASLKSDGKLFKRSLDLNALHSMIENGGKEGNSGLRKFVDIPKNKIDPNLLVPQVYVLEKPSESDLPVPLTELCSLGMSHIFDVKESLPEDTPWVMSGDLSATFRGTLDMSSLEKAGCPNNPEGWKYGNRKLSRFGLAAFGNEYSNEDIHISHYRNCRYVDGSKDVVLFKITKEGIITALINATGKAIAVSSDIHVLYPNSKIDALSLLAIINLPIVYRQIDVYEKYGLYGSYGHLKDILVPTDKRIILDAKKKLEDENKEYNTLKEKYNAQKTEYINEVRMRKHDMGQYIFELVNIEDLMRYYLDNRETEKDFCQQIENLLDNFRSSLGELSTLLDNLSKEEQFGDSEPLNVDDILSNLTKRHKADGFKIVYERDVESIEIFNCKKQTIVDFVDDVDNADNSLQVDDVDFADNTLSVDDIDIEDEDYSVLEDDIEDDNNSSINIEDYIVLNNKKENKKVVIPISDGIPTISVSKNDFQRTVNNIIDNARRHGFTDPNRDDYEINVKLFIDNERKMIRIDFSNNGNPLPDGMNKTRYGIKGEKAGKTGGTGIGGNYVKSFVDHYGGDYDIFMEEGWTVVRIYLPIK